MARLESGLRSSQVLGPVLTKTWQVLSQFLAKLDKIWPIPANSLHAFWLELKRDQHWFVNPTPVFHCTEQDKELVPGAK